MNSITCSDPITVESVMTSSGVYKDFPFCSSGWQVIDALSGGVTIDYMASGAFFAAAFSVSATLVVSTNALKVIMAFAFKR